MHTFTHTHTYTHIRTYIQTYIHTHMHTHTHTKHTHFHIQPHPPNPQGEYIAVEKLEATYGKAKPVEQVGGNVFGRV